MTLRFGLAAMMLQIGCDPVATATGHAENSIAYCAESDEVRELPDDDVVLLAHVDMYISSTNHAQWRTYTLPTVDSFREITISKVAGHCDIEDSMSFVDEHGHVLFDIVADGLNGCRGWATVATVGPTLDWRLVEFGGAVSW